MKNKYLLLLPILLISFTLISAFSGSGDGSEGDPYQITNCTQLQEMKDDFGYFPSSYPYYVLINDIDCYDTYNWNEGAGFEVFANNIEGGASGDYFYGFFDGQEYTISGLYINRPSTNGVGLFGYIYGSTIQNLILNDCYINGGYLTGGAVGYFEGGTVDNIDIYGEVYDNPNENCSGYTSPFTCRKNKGCSWSSPTCSTLNTNGITGNGNPTSSTYTYEPYSLLTPVIQGVGDTLGEYDSLITEPTITGDVVAPEQQQGIGLFAMISNWFKAIWEWFRGIFR